MIISQAEEKKCCQKCGVKGHWFNAIHRVDKDKNGFLLSVKWAYICDPCLAAALGLSFDFEEKKKKKGKKTA
jgi:hypothetical protein